VSEHYDDDDDPSEVLRRAIEARSNPRAIVRVKTRPAKPGAKAVDALFEDAPPPGRSAPKDAPDAEVDEGDEPLFAGLPEVETEKAIADFIQASGNLVGAAGRAIQQEGGLARKQTHNLIDEITHGVSTVLDAMMHPDKYK
jgi:hypothetical protein